MPDNNENQPITAESQITEQSPQQQLEGGTYEIIQSRLQKQNQDLRSRLQQLNDQRKNIFGNVETVLIASDRITTQNNCIAADIVALGNRCIFGYNVYMGLKLETQISDVFNVYDFDKQEHSFHEADTSLLEDPRFQEDFKNLYKYYRHTRFLQFTVIGAYLYMVFQIGKTTQDIKAFKWAITNEDSLVYVDDRNVHELRLPEQFEFEWIKTQRSMQKTGKHPHVSIKDRLFVETVGGDLTIKVEDNTDEGKGIYSEEVEHRDQTLDDAEFYYADLGNLIALKIRPYRENFRYFVFNEKVQEVKRVDTLEDSAVLLPDSQGLIFSDGYYLQTGEFKQFDKQMRGMYFDRRITSPNGEDTLYVFYHSTLKEYILMSYNLIEQKVATPILCNGYTHFDTGELCYFRAEKEPTKHHLIQIWRTPFTKDQIVATADPNNFLYKVGNKDIVSAMAACSELITLLNKEDSYNNLYLDLVKKSTDLLDTFYWINRSEAFQLHEPLNAIKATANNAIEEFEKVQRIKASTRKAVENTSKKADTLFNKIKRTRFGSVEIYVQALADFRALRGETISLKELRYVDLQWINELEEKIALQTDRLSNACVQFLLQDDALLPYQNKVLEQQEALQKIEKVTEANQLSENLDTISKELELLIDIVSNLKIDDATQTTQIIDSISGIFVQLNRLKAQVKNKRKDLTSVEAVAEFNAQLKLLDQSIINYLDICDTPLKCDEYLTKLMVSLEELEGKFVDFDEFTLQIGEKRDEIYNAFESKKLQLTESRNRRTTTLQSSAGRIFKGIQNRLKGFKTVENINSYFATDLMVDKVRDIIKTLVELDDNVKADDIQSQLKTLREEAIRQLKDRQELFVAGENVIKFGRHHFSVNVQPLDLTIVPRNETMYFHLSGTNFFEKIDDPAFLETKNTWNQTLVSENRLVYRAEYLAYQLFKILKDKNKKYEADFADLIKEVQNFAATRYSEGYTKGVHDQDAAIILKALLQLNAKIGLLRYAPDMRACANLYWQIFENQEDKQLLNTQLKSIGVILEAFPSANSFDIMKDLTQEIHTFLEETPLFEANIAEKAGEYLFYELTQSDDFVISKATAELYQAFHQFLKNTNLNKKYTSSLAALNAHPAQKFKLISNWLDAFIQSEYKDKKDLISYFSTYKKETTSLLILDNFHPKKVVEVSVESDLDDLTGSHSCVEKGGKYHLNYHDFMQKMAHFEVETVPQFEQFSDLKKQLTSNFRKQLRLNEFKPRVLSSFVRNQLIDKVYLPLIGDNLAKQIGVVGENKRTDLMGMLLLISPPGYGKTTLMEYVASRLGLIFMKINGPAIGHQVTAVDPAEAPNAGAREELKKLNLAFEMGDNVMIYLDDIQHCNPEFLQKFISLCDGQRKIEGVYKGVSKTYDLRGKKVCVIMAGNPYTESGDKFTIPDMLANRADTYNLGDIIGDTAALFKLSYIENCLTSNPVLNRLASKSNKDVYTLIKIAETGDRDGINFEANHTPTELNEYINVLEKLLKVRDVILKVNLEYIASAAQAEDYRTEPSFKLQGSYRDMNKLAEKVVPIMNEEELATLILSHYEGESQTLTTGAEANLLKFKELNNLLSEVDQKRWTAIKETFMRNKMIGGLGQDRMGQLVGQMNAIAIGLDDYSKAFVEGFGAINEHFNKKEE